MAPQTNGGRRIDTFLIARPWAGIDQKSIDRMGLQGLSDERETGVS